MSGKQLWLLVSALSIVALFASACLESRADRRLSPADEDLARRVILKNHCGSCHTLQARSLNLTGKIGPDLTRQARRGRSPDWLRQQILDATSIPDPEVAPGFEGKQKLMPRLNPASARELDALIAFLRSLD